jgi:tetratricopeptide (TPR) repeat protein
MKENTVEIDGNNNIAIQDVENGCITINVNDTERLIEFFKTATDEIKQELQAVLAKQNSSIFEKAKNCVAGTITAGGNVHIVDKTITNYNYQNKTRLPKPLTSNIPKLTEEEIVGRKKDLVELQQMLFENKQVVLVNGLGGIGKTTLAQVYIDKYSEKYKHIAWISQKSEDISFDIASNSDLAKNLEINILLTDTNDILNEIIRKLNCVEQYPNLLILDNADFSLEKIRHKLPKQPNWHILITSRNELNGFRPKQLGFLNKEDAFKLFKSHYTRNNLSDAQINKLIEIIDYHTLTIEILAKTAQRQRYDFETLKNALTIDAKANVKISRPEIVKIDRITSFLCSIFSISKLNENELWLLKQFACLPSEFLNYELLNELIRPAEYNKQDVFSETLEELSQKFWLLKIAKTDSYKMHRIIAEVVIKQIPIVVKEITPLIKSVTEKLFLDYSKDNPIDKFWVIPFGNSIVRLIKDFPIYTPNDSLLFNNLALMLKEMGNYKQAKSLLEITSKSNEKNFGVEHLVTAASYSNLASVLQVLGDYKQAKSLFEKASKSDEKNFGLGHQNTAVNYSNLASVLQDLGDYKQAKSLFEKASKLDKKNFGVEHPNTARSYSNLASVLQDLGDYKQSKSLFEKAIKSNEKNLGAEHPTTAASYSNLASVLQVLGDYKQAKSLFEKASKSDEKNFGVEHPNTARSYSNLALVLKDLRDYKQAKNLLEKACKSAEKNFGKEHPNTARVYSNLALVLQDQGDYKLAKNLFEIANKSDEKNFGVEHPNTARSYSNLATVLQNLGENKQAKSLLEKASKSNEKNFGVEHPNTAGIYSNLANVLYVLGEYEEAKRLFDKAYLVYKKLLGENHPDTKIFKGNLEHCLQQMGG